MEGNILIVRIVKFKYLISYRCRLVILSAQVYTMNSSSCTSQKDYLFSDSGINNQKMQEVSLSSHHSGLNPFILRMDDMILISEKIEALQFKTIVTARLLRVNGSPFVVPIEYAAILTQILGCNETITFFPDSHDDFFLIALRISLALTEESRNLTQDQHKEIGLQLQKYRKFLTFVGSIKDKTINSLRFHKNNLKLKANIARSLKSNKILIDQSYTKSQIFTNDNYPLVVASINEESSNKFDGQRFVKKGGYFSVQKQQCQITKCDGSSFKQPLAIKKIRYDKNSNGGEAKMNHELEIIKKMRNKKYLVNYYKPIGKQWFAMDFIEKNLKDLKYSQKILTIKEIFSICMQLIEAVSLLHQSNIVHRDLKPENILVDLKGQIKIKLIDFGESAQMGLAYDEKHRLGCTIPYSPIECMINCPEGYNNPAIDLWSVVIMIYQLIFKQMPVYYNRKMHHVLITGWKGQEQDFDFTTVLCHRPKRGLRKIQEYAYLLAQQGLKIEQKQRLKLPVILSYLKSLQIFYNDMISSLRSQN